MVFWMSPGLDQNVNIEKQLRRGFCKGLKVLVCHSKGVIKVKFVAENTLEKLGDGQNGEKCHSDNKGSQ